MPAGLSMFDLIMPWKNEVKQETETDLEKRGLAKVIAFSDKKPIWKCDLGKHAADVQAIMLNPPWSMLSIEQFKEFSIPASVMKDGLLFIWVEKEIISDVIKSLEAQEFFYVENVCFVMLDQAAKSSIDSTRKIDISASYVK